MLENQYLTKYLSQNDVMIRWCVDVIMGCCWWLLVVRKNGWWLMEV